MCVAESLRCSPGTAQALKPRSALPQHEIKGSQERLGAVPLCLWLRMWQRPRDPPPEAQTLTGAAWPRHRRLKEEDFKCYQQPQLTAPLKGRDAQEQGWSSEAVTRSLIPGLSNTATFCRVFPETFAHTYD